MEFTGKAAPLSQPGFDAARNVCGVADPLLWSVVAVETSGCGFLPDRRPRMLFERHIFHQLTGGRFDDDDSNVSSPLAGGYGAAGAHQYDRLEAAADLDLEAALKSASWGLGQIMGENAQAAGFADVAEMISEMADSEDAQLLAMTRFIRAAGMDDVLREQDWPGFALRYNGPNYAANNYDGLLQHFYARFSSGDLPNLHVRAAQIYLMFKGFSPGVIDGIMGSNTAQAIKRFETANGLPVTGEISDGLMARLAM